jgi:pimeloyl-ACP methyl ester carboxylesterase
VGVVAGIAMGIIDGTGAFRDATYAKEMQHSFCKQLDDSLGASSYYQQGPSSDGLNDGFKAARTVDWLKQQRATNPSVRIMLAGYSRGAATAMAVAELLGYDDIPVDSMFLFDAVARHMLITGRSISANVQYCRHAMRLQDPAFVAKYETYILDNKWTGRWANPFTGNVTRPWFSNVGGDAGACKNFVKNIFQGSHGALGGVGWKKVPEDEPAQKQVAQWMNSALSERGVAANLKSFPPSSE